MNAKTLWSRPLTRVTLIVLGLLVVLLAAIAGAVQYFGTPAGSARLLAWAQNTLERDYGTRLEFSEGRFSLFSGFHFKNLRIFKQDPFSQLEFKAENIDVAYSWSLLARSVKIETLDVIHPSLVLHSNSSSAPPEDPAAPSGLERLAEWIQNPPAQVQIHSLKIQGLSVDLDMREASNRLQARIQNLDLGLTLQLEKEKLAIAGALQNETGSQVTQTTVTPDGTKIESSFQLTNSAKWNIAIQREDGVWKYGVDATDLRLKLRDLSLRQLAAQNSMTLALPSVEIQSGVKLRAHGSRLLERAQTTVDTTEGDLKGNLGRLTLEQNEGSVQQRSTIDAQILRMTAQLKEDVQVEFNHQAQGFYSQAQFLKPADLRVKAKLRLPRDLSQLDIETEALLSNSPLFKFAGTLIFGSELNGNGKAQLQADPKLAQILKSATALKSTGAVVVDSTISGKWNADQNHLALTADTTVENTRFGQWNLKTESEFTPAQESNGSHSGPRGAGRSTLHELKAPKGTNALPVELLKPFTLQHRFDWTPGHQDLHFDGEVPAVAFAQVGQLNGTKFSLDAKGANLAGSQDLDLSIELKQSDVALDAKSAARSATGLQRLTGLYSHATATLRRGREFSLDSFSLGLTEPQVKLSAQATGDLKAQNLLGQADLAINWPKNFVLAPGRSIRGRVSLPVRFSVLEGKEISTQGHIELENVAWQKGAQAAQGISGRIPFSEKILLSGDHLSFAHLISQNPFERVDFERVRPLLEGTERIRIEKLTWEEKTFGPLLGYFSLRQNMIFAHQFDLDLGQGHAYGQMFLDAFPRNMQVGVLARLTGLDLGEVLPKKFLARAPSGGKHLSGRTGFVVNLNRSTMDGRLDITEIGGPQLISMINVLDPLYEDEKLNNVRSLLQVGYPTAVELAFADGYMDMQVALSVLGVSQRQSVRGIPISSLLSNATADLMKQTKKGPLK